MRQKEGWRDLGPEEGQSWKDRQMVQKRDSSEAKRDGGILVWMRDSGGGKRDKGIWVQTMDNSRGMERFRSRSRTVVEGQRDLAPIEGQYRGKGNKIIWRQKMDSYGGIQSPKEEQLWKKEG